MKTHGKKLWQLLAGVLALAVLSGAYFVLLRHNQNAAANSSSLSEAGTPLGLPGSDTLDTLSFTRAGTTLSFEKGDDGVWYEADDRDFPVSQDKLKTLADNLSSLSAVTSLSPDSDADMADFGLAEPPLTVTGSAGGTSFTLEVGDANSSTGHYYLRLNGDAATLYTIEDALPTAYAVDLFDLMAYEALPAVTASSITSVAVHTGDGTLTLSPGTADVLAKDAFGAAVWQSADETGAYPADNTTVSTVLSDLAGLSFDACAAYKPSEDDLSLYGLANGGTTLTLKYADTSDSSSGSSSDSVAADKTLTLNIGTTTADDASYYVTSPAMKGVYLVNKDKLANLLTGRAIDFVSLYVCPIPTGDVDTLTVEKDGASKTLTVASSTATDESGSESTAYTYTVDGETIASENALSVLNALSSLTGTAPRADGYGFDFAAAQPALTLTFGVHGLAQDAYTVKLYRYDDENYIVEQGCCAVLVAASSLDSALASVT